MSLLNDVMRDLQTRGVLSMPALAGLHPVGDIPQSHRRRHLLVPVLGALTVVVAVVMWRPVIDDQWASPLAWITGVEPTQPDPVAQYETGQAIEVGPAVPATGNDLRGLFSIEPATSPSPASQTGLAADSVAAENAVSSVESPEKDSLVTADLRPVESEPAIDPPTVEESSAPEPSISARAAAKTSIVRREPGLEDVDGIVMRAQRAVQERDLVTAEKLFREALAIDSGDAQIWTYLYTVLVGASRPAAAEQALLQGLSQANETTALAKFYARLLVDRDDKESAVRVLNTHRPAPTADTEYDAFLAALLQQTGSYAEAGDIYRSLLAIDPRSGPWLIGLGMSDDSLGNVAQALVGFERALESGSLKPPLDRYARRRIAELKAYE